MVEHALREGLATGVGTKVSGETWRMEGAESVLIPFWAEGLLTPQSLVTHCKYIKLLWSARKMTMSTL